jgi:hypothetical protein
MGEPVSREPYKFGTDRQKIFLDALKDGKRRCEAAALAGVRRATVCEYVKRCPAFQHGIDQAEIEGAAKELEVVENCLLAACKKGNITAIIFYLQNRGDWKDKRNLAVTTNTTPLTEEQIRDEAKRRGIIE